MSQQKMLGHREKAPEIDDKKMAVILEKHVKQMKDYLTMNRIFTILAIHF